LKLSRAHPKFLAKLFETETPEIASGVVEIKNIAREPGARSKIAVISHDPHIDPIGSMVGQRGVRVTTVTSELSGEKIDIIEWNEDPALFIEEALSPAEVVSIEIIDEEHRAIVTVTEMLLAAAVTVDAQTFGDKRFDIRSRSNANRARIISAPQKDSHNGTDKFLRAVQRGHPATAILHHPQQ
jgi:transcription termination factor NusA